MSDRDHLDPSPVVVDDVQHAVVTDTYPVRVLPLKLDDAGWPRCQTQARDPLDDPIVRAAWEVAQLALG